MKVLCIPKSSIGDFMVFWSAFQAWVGECHINLTIVVEERWSSLIREFGCDDVISYPDGNLRHGALDSKIKTWKIQTGEYDLLLDFMGSEASIACVSEVKSTRKGIFCPAIKVSDYEKIVEFSEWEKIAKKYPVEGMRDAIVIARMTGWRTPHILERATLEH